MRNGMAEIYAAYDSNSDGALDAQEVPDLRDLEGQPILNKDAMKIDDIMAQAPTIFAKLDRDSDGFLTVEEFSASGGKAPHPSPTDPSKENIVKTLPLTLSSLVLAVTALHAPDAAADRRIRCESTDGRQVWCAADTQYGVRLRHAVLALALLPG